MSLVMWPFRAIDSQSISYKNLNWILIQIMNISLPLTGNTSANIYYIKDYSYSCLPFKKKNSQDKTRLFLTSLQEFDKGNVFLEKKMMYKPTEINKYTKKCCLNQTVCERVLNTLKHFIKSLLYPYPIQKS